MTPSEFFDRALLQFASVSTPTEEGFAEAARRALLLTGVRNATAPLIAPQYPHAQPSGPQSQELGAERTESTDDIDEIGG